jgi:hypothetical protein
MESASRTRVAVEDLITTTATTLCYRYYRRELSFNFSSFFRVLENFACLLNGYIHGFDSSFHYSFVPSTLLFFLPLWFE